MKESSGKTKKPSKGVKRARSLRNVVMMVLICALMLSAATYAWFTLSKNAKVADLTMQVGEETSLMIAPDTDKTGNAGKAGTYGSTLSFGEGSDGDYYIEFALQPATMKDDGKIYKPTYSDDGNTVTGVGTTTDANIMTDASTSDTGAFYCYKTTFFLKTAGNKEVKIQLKAPDKTMTAYAAPENGVGTYLINKTPDDMGAGAIRIKLSDGTNSIVYEPLSDYSLPSGTYESAEDKSGVTPIATTNVQKADGTFEKQEKTLTVQTTDTRITMEVWLEGTDSCCVNQIMADQIMGQLVFEVFE